MWQEYTYLKHEWRKEVLNDQSRACTRGQVTGTLHSDSHSRLWMTVGMLVSAKSARMTWCFKWTPHLEKFSENALWASSSQNWRERRAKSEDEEAPERRGFRAGVDLRLGVIDMTNVNRKRGRERKTIRKVPSNSNITSILKREYVCMGNAWTYDMQKKLHHGLSPIQTYQHTNSLHTSKCMTILL